MNYRFVWDLRKEIQNIAKHGFTFKMAMEVFSDPKVMHLEDEKHSSEEDRYYAIGKLENGLILTVRYAVKENIIRIFGAANWRKWRKFYEKNTRS